MMNLPPCLRFLGILNRGGKTLVGPSLFTSKRLCLLLLAKDASKRTQKEILALARKLDIPYDSRFDKEELGLSLGFHELSAIGIIDKKAAEAYLEKAAGKETL